MGTILGVHKTRFGTLREGWRVLLFNVNFIKGPSCSVKVKKSGCSMDGGGGGGAVKMSYVTI